MVVPSTQQIKPGENVEHKVYQVPLASNSFDNLIRLEVERRKFETLRKLPETLAGLWEGALNSTELLNELKGFDLIVYDNMAFYGPLVGDLLGIPRVEIFLLPPNWHLLQVYHMAPMPISYVPQFLTGFTDNMTFMERLMNLGVYLAGKIFVRLTYDRIMNGLKVKYNITPERSFQESIGDAELVIITADFALEYPQPLLPGMNNNVSTKREFWQTCSEKWKSTSNLFPLWKKIPSITFRD